MPHKGPTFQTKLGSNAKGEIMSLGLSTLQFGGCVTVLYCAALHTMRTASWGTLACIIATPFYYHAEKNK